MHNPLALWLRSIGEELHVETDKIDEKRLDELNPCSIISYNYRYIIKKNVLAKVEGFAINLHISYLPYNRGAHPNIWSFLENTIKGVTIHCIDEGVDTGDIIIQEMVSLSRHEETLSSSYRKLHDHMQQLFKKNWNDIKNGKITPKSQNGPGTYHNKKDFESVNKLIIRDNWDMKIESLIENYRSMNCKR